MTAAEAQKASGTYYTPSTLSDFIVYHIFGHYHFQDKICVLEPSAGDGIFFKSIFNNKLFGDRFVIPSQLDLTAVERDAKAYEKLKLETNSFESSNHRFTYLNDDYLKFQTQNTEKYDLIVGNPPYIQSKHLTKDQIKLCENIHRDSHLSVKKIKNIWTSFLVGGVQSLSSEGVMCFVLPAELLQVIYAKELRDFLRDNFQKIEIFTFNELIFPDIEQDVIVLICAKKQAPGVSFYHVDKLDDLKVPTYVEDHSNIHRETLDKWTNYILSDEELVFLDRLKNDLGLQPIKNYCRAEVGVVTAANSYFIVDNNVVAESPELKRLSRPIIQKGMHITPGATFTSGDLRAVRKASKPSYFLAFKDRPESSFNQPIRAYLSEGRKLQIDQRYKCKLRKRWYVVPSTWVSDGFFTKRSNIFPRMIMNEAGSLVTDSFYRIKMNEGKNIRDFVFSFYNSLTFIYAELEGRYYGGSVLELMPSECKNLPIPYRDGVDDEEFQRLDSLLRTNVSISEILNYTNTVILQQGYGVSDRDLIKLDGIYKKLLRRRLKSHQYVY